jgi:SAM-dependent methyltransferase
VAFYPFKPEFDLIFSRSGVMFFDDPVRAFANIRKGAASGARLAFVAWRAPKENERAMVPFSAAKPHLPNINPADPNAPGPFAFADPGRVRAILSEAGFHDVAIEAFDGVMDLGDMPEHASFQSTQLIGPTSRAFRDADEETRVRIYQAVKDVVACLLSKQGHLRLGIACWLVSAKS